MCDISLHVEQPTKSLSSSHSCKNLPASNDLSFVFPSVTPRNLFNSRVQPPFPRHCDAPLHYITTCMKLALSSKRVSYLYAPCTLLSNEIFGRDGFCLPLADSCAHLPCQQGGDTHKSYRKGPTAILTAILPVARRECFCGLSLSVHRLVRTQLFRVVKHLP